MNDSTCSCTHSAHHLTFREVEVLLLAASGHSNGEIATRLSISVRTVDRHMAAMLRRSMMKTRAGLVARAYAAGVLLAKVWPPQWSGRRCLVER